jgi:hypothetical protein
MKSAILLLFSFALLAACVFFYYRGGELIVGKDYLGGVLHIVAGLALTRAGVELARLSALTRPERHTP